MLFIFLFICFAGITFSTNGMNQLVESTKTTITNQLSYYKKSMPLYANRLKCFGITCAALTLPLSEYIVPIQHLVDDQNITMAIRCALSFLSLGYVVTSPYIHKNIVECYFLEQKRDDEVSYDTMRITLTNLINVDNKTLTNNLLYNKCNSCTQPLIKANLEPILVACPKSCCYHEYCLASKYTGSIPHRHSANAGQKIIMKCICSKDIIAGVPIPSDFLKTLLHEKNSNERMFFNNNAEKIHQQINTENCFYCRNPLNNNSPLTILCTNVHCVHKECHQEMQPTVGDCSMCHLPNINVEIPKDLLQIDR